MAVRKCHKRSQTEEECAWEEGECRRRAGCRTEKLHVRMTRALLKAEGTDGPSSNAPVKIRSRWSAQNRFRTFGHLLKGTGREKKMETQISILAREYVFLNDSLFQSVRKKQHADLESRTLGSRTKNLELRGPGPETLLKF